METLMLLLIFPAMWPFVAMKIWENITFKWEEYLIGVISSVVLVLLVWNLGVYSTIYDTEIWNGYVVSKERIHGSYVESYDCRCRDVSNPDGTTSESCDTCYRDHYTVTWSAETTVGSVTFGHKDSLSSSVYDSPDPEGYVNCRVGEPASVEHSYVNYVKAVPDTLFRTYDDKTDLYKAYVPLYPRVFDHYKIRRVINVNADVPNSVLDEINLGLNEELKTLAKQKEVNIIVILTSITDPKYRYSVEGQWIGAKKNDVVVFVGVNDGKIIWADAMTWALNSGNELFHVKMRDGIKGLSIVDPSTMVPFIAKTVNEYFDRPHMKDYEYLKNAIKPPFWVIVIAFLFGVLTSVGLTLFFHQEEIGFLNKRRYL